MSSGWKRLKKSVKGFKVSVDDEMEIFVTKLVIRKATKKDAGPYTCEIANRNKTSRAEIQLVVETKPQKPNSLVIRLMRGKDFYKKVGDVVVIDRLVDLRIDCVVSGFPVPKVTWFKDDTQLPTKEVSLPKADIEKHAGQYKIVVENSAGKISHTFEVKVKLGPTTKREKYQKHEIDEEERITLNCDIVGNPEPEISWAHNGDDLVNSNRHDLTHANKILRFYGAVELSGNYTCTGKNIQGQEQITFAVFVKGNV